MAGKTKFFRVAVEGATTDGRKIERTWLLEIAKNYNREKYGARIFIEHIRGYHPEFGFRCLGDVLSVKTETIEIDGKKVLALFAQIEPTAELVALTKAKQKIYSSIEVNPDFAGSGEAYLVGLGATDSPASLGTDVLEFAAQHPHANPFAARKQHPGNVFSAAIACEIEFEDAPADTDPTWFSRITDLLKGRSTTDDARFADVHSAVEQVAQATISNTNAVSTLTQELTDLRATLAQHQQAVTDLGNQLNHTPNRDPQRPPATGGNGAVATDC